MFLELDDVLTPAEVARLRQIAERARFVDGRISNPDSAIKNNLQIDPQDPGYRESGAMLRDALMRHEELRAYVLPKMVLPPLLAKYVPGMNYGAHVDSAFLPVGARPIRSDMSCTIFVADPAAYEGGELSIRLGSRTVEVKGVAGSAVVYPSTTLHEVRPVTSGQRLVAITFMESQVVDVGQREMLYQLGKLVELEGRNMSAENLMRLEYVRQSLHRLWGSAA